MEYVSVSCSEMLKGKEKLSDVQCIKQPLVYCNCRMPSSFSNEIIQCGKCRSGIILEICVRVEDLRRGYTRQLCCTQQLQATNCPVCLKNYCCVQQAARL